MARGTLKYIMGAGIALSAGLLALAATTTSAAAQSPSVAPTAPSSLATPTTPVAPGVSNPTSPGTPSVISAPVGHRQPRPSDLPPDLQREEKLAPVQAAPSERTKVSNERRSRNARGRSAVPAFDVKKSCKTTEDAALSLGRSLESCISSEEAAREQLENRWAEFPGAKQVECVGVSRIGGTPSYIEVLTCLELAQDLERIRSAPAETTGVGGGNN
ncbi:MAG: hypothetical protein WAL02_17450 [Rhodoplanes sp.]